MKSIVKSILLLFLSSNFISCKEDKSENQSAPHTHNTKTEKVIPPTTTTNDLKNFSSLVPLTIVDSTSTNVYEKFGIEFTGNCYNCDLAKIKIDQNTFAFVNICEKMDFYSIEKFTHTFTDEELKIRTDQNEFIFTKIDNAPIYKIDLKGSNFSLTNKRIATYYTNEKIITKFKEHNCGDFEG